MQLLFFNLLISLAVFAQHEAQPQKENASDLREGVQIFRISDLKNERQVWLERTLSLDYFLRMKISDNAEQIQKITTKEGKKLDSEFASRFLKCQYEFPPSPEGCEVTLRLSMKGETQVVCDKDEKKAQEMMPFLQQLLKRF
jgi:hypothetical protein